MADVRKDQKREGLCGHRGGKVLSTKLTKKENSDYQRQKTGEPGALKAAWGRDQNNKAGSRERMLLGYGSGQQTRKGGWGRYLERRRGQRKKVQRLFYMRKREKFPMEEQGNEISEQQQKN